MKSKSIILANIFIILISNVVRAQVVWDSTFNNIGITSRIFYAGVSTPAYSQLVLNNGRILANGGGFGDYGCVYGFKNDGSVDRGYGSSGINETACVGSTKMALATHDTIYVIGKGTTSLGKDAIVATKLDSTGKIVSGFGSGGILQYEVIYHGWNYGCNALAVAVQPDSKVLIASEVSLMFPLTEIKRFNAKGELDTSFGSGGIVELDLASCGYMVKGLYPLPSGKIIVTGDYYTTGSTEYFSAIRLNSDGNYDSTYGINGHVETYAAFNGNVMASYMQKDGKVIVAGTNAVRYTVDGALDTAFGINGLYSESFNITGVDEDTTGKIYMLGALPPYVYLSRLTVSGKLDKSFNNTGYFSFAQAAALDTKSVTAYKNGKVLMYGDYRDASYDNNLFLARINAHPAIDLLDSGKNIYCEGDEAKLYVHTSGHIHWYRDTVLLTDTTKSIILKQTGYYKAVTYSGTDTDTSFAIQIIFNARPIPTLTIIGDSIICNGGGSEYNWYDATDNKLLFTSSDSVFHPAGGGSYYAIVSNASGCTAQSASTIYTPSSLPMVKGVNKYFEVFPNPISSLLQIQNNTNVEVEASILNVEGKEIMKLQLKPGINRYSDLFSTLPAQLLLLNIRYVQHVYSLRLNYINR